MILVLNTILLWRLSSTTVAFLSVQIRTTSMRFSSQVWVWVWELSLGLEAATPPLIRRMTMYRGCHWAHSQYLWWVMQWTRCRDRSLSRGPWTLWFLQECVEEDGVIDPCYVNCDTLFHFHNRCASSGRTSECVPFCLVNQTERYCN